MKAIMLFIFNSMVILPGCSNKVEKEPYPVYEGTVVFKTDENEKYKFLVLQNISKEDLENGNLEDFIELAQDQEASFSIAKRQKDLNVSSERKDFLSFWFQEFGVKSRAVKSDRPLLSLPSRNSFK
ncbi:hypothetical protein C0Q44_17785 [Paenibacillus sp. PCH8]|uniref:hypothetical protein n=1 Tax=Paenibacillus sp. PCH8 TaxID=2066524 RepID=UPI000CF84C0E|nr:hypothetical protein [Paenibacillus sp. PCH8]PQP81567.1 hypothetical protein C0Q44_17785 [Paenibacillus sp. PCH8]